MFKSGTFSFPALLVILVSIPFGRLLQNSSHKMLWMLGGVSLYRIGYNTAMSIGPFIFPLVGVSLAGRFGISATVIGCGLLALLGSLSFSIWKINFDPE